MFLFILFLFFLSGEFLLHIPYWFNFLWVSFFYTSHAGFIFIGGISLTHPVLASFLSGEFLLHTPCWIYFSEGSFSYTSRVGVFGVFFFFFIDLGSFSYTSRTGYFFYRGVSLIHPVLGSFLSEVFLLHIPF